MTEEKTCKFRNKMPPYERCDEPPLKGSEFCLYHKPDKTAQEIELFKERIKEKLRNKDYDFREFVFLGGTDFFDAKTFERKVDFTYAQFQEADFEGGRFAERAIFWKAQFKKAEFGGRQFFKDTDFAYAQFQEADFSDAEFKGQTSFKGTYFEKIANISPYSIEGEISFQNAIIENISMTPLNLRENALIDFKNARLRNTEIARKDVEGHIRQEEKGDFAEAKEVYLRLKNNFHTLGRYDDESWAFQKEKEMERKSYSKNKRCCRWAWSKFLSLLYGYGERPERVVASAALVIVLFAFLFFGFGIERYPWDDLPKRNIAQEVWLGITQGDFITRMHNVPWSHFLNCLYFSGVTFTTLGYGDFRPRPGASRLISWTEAFIGALMMALFIYTFARRTGGR